MIGPSVSGRVSSSTTGPLHETSPKIEASVRDGRNRQFIMIFRIPVWEPRRPTPGPSSGFRYTTLAPARKPDPESLDSASSCRHVHYCIIRMVKVVAMLLELWA
jgi:hypothetical protein